MHTGYVSADPHFTITRTIFGVPYYSAVQAPDGPGYWTSVSYAVQTVVLRNPDIDLTTAGRWIIIATRVLGTTLLGLALFSIRGRVKR
jgi:hypothetical protein